MAGITKDANSELEQQQVQSANTDEKMRRVSEIKGWLRNYSYQQANQANVSLNATANLNIEEVIDEDTEEVERTSLAEEENGSIMGSMEDILRPKALLRKEDWQGKNNGHKLDSVLEAVNKLYTMHEQTIQRLKPLEIAVFDKENVILPQISQMVGHAKSVDTKYEDLQAENLQLRDELEIVKGVVSKQGKQIEILQHKQAEQTARSMANNVTISGILGDTEKADQMECKAHALNFLDDVMKLDVEDEQVLSAQRFGLFVMDRHRPLVIKVTDKLYQKIFANTNKLSKITNQEDRPYSVNPQLPDLLAEK